jgi:hypothetical protein
MALILMGLFLIMGIGFLSQRVAQNEAARAFQSQVQAEALAQAGLSDAVTKLAKRSSFPPLEDKDQRLFVYTEPVTDGSGQVVGEYEVTVDMTYAKIPYGIARLTSVGRAGGPGRFVAERSLRAELDISAYQRSPAGNTTPNADRFHFHYVGDAP